MKYIKIITSILALAGLTTTFADVSTDLVNQCSMIVNMSDIQFSQQAPSLNSILDSCLAANICSQIKNDNCANIIASRDYLSNYLASAPSDSSKFGANLFPSVPDSNPITNPVSSAPSNNNFNTSNNSGNTNNNTNKEIHWF